MKKQRLFNIEVKSFHTGTEKKFSENFISKAEAEIFCIKQYKFYLWVKLNGILVVDNTKNYKTL